MHSGGCSGADLLSSDSPDRGKEPDIPSEPAPQVKLAIAHVLFIDIVGYSKLLITQQTELLGKLTLQKAYRTLGESDYWQKRLDSTKRLYDQGTAPASAIAGIYAILGEDEQALTWLEKAFEESDDFLVFLNIQPQFEGLHSDPRFQALVQRIFHASSAQVAVTATPF